ncbi:MAG: DUF58 domain-containing protein [Planctomycetes bacterium]|nr:DUF58 domain-containing protein [Planctomycetota bacterium]
MAEDVPTPPIAAIEPEPRGHSRRARLWSFPRPTRWGWYFLVCSVGIFLAGSHTGRNAFILLACIPMAMILINLLAVLFNLRGIEVRRRLPTVAHVGEWLEILLDVRNTGRVLPRFALVLEDDGSDDLIYEDHAQLLMAVAPHGSQRAGYSAAFARRGRQRLSSCTVSTSFPFGLVRMSRRVPVRSEITVYPRPTRLSHELEERLMSRARYFGESSAASRGDDEVFGVREYRPGENIRRIHWRTSARMGKPMILEMEGRHDTNYVLLFDTAPLGDPGTLRNRLEAAVGVCAGLTYFLTREGASFRFAHAGAELVISQPGRGDRNYHAIMEQLALAGLSEKPLSEWIGNVGVGRFGEAAILITLGPKEHAEAHLPGNAGAVVLGAADTDFKRHVAFDPLGRKSVGTAETSAIQSGVHE